MIKCSGLTGCVRAIFSKNQGAESDEGCSTSNNTYTRIEIY